MFVDHFEHPATAAGDAGQRIFSDYHGQPGFFHDQAIQVAQQRAAAGEHDAAFGDIGTQFGRSLFECILDR